MIKKYSIDIFKPNWPQWKIKLVDFFLTRLPVLHVGTINKVIANSEHLSNREFIWSCLKDMGIKIHTIGTEAIPKEGPLTIAANHPGGADVMALISTIGMVREDPSILANSLVCIEPVKDIVIPVDKLASKNAVDFNQIDKAYENGRAVVFFAAGMNSRPDESGNLVDRRWRATYLQYAKKYKTPVILMHIDKGNSPLFFKVANIRAKYKRLAKVPLENIFQLREFVKAKGDINVLVSECISYNEVDRLLLNETKKDYRELADKMRDFVYTMSPNEREFNA